MDIIPFDNRTRKEQYFEPEENETTGAFYMKSRVERAKVRPVETPKIELELAGPHEARAFIHNRA
jgi:hypothetical protein